MEVFNPPAPALSASYLADISGALYQSICGSLSAQNGPALFTTAVPAGVGSLFIPFPNSYSTCPKVSPALNTAAEIGYQLIIKEISLSGYIVALSDIVTETGVMITTVVKL